MTASAVHADPDVISKAEFARRRGVSPGRVSQWISEKKIFGAAIVGEGRFAQIRESIACEQLRRALDPMQMTANGLSTKLDAPLPVVLPFERPPADGAAPSPSPGTIEDKIKAARLEGIERQNREARRDEAVKAGRLTDLEVATRATGREVARLVNMFEGSLSNFATAIAAEFKLPQRDVLHLLRSEFRKFRADAAAAAREVAKTLPAMVDVELADHRVADDDSSELEDET